MSDPLITPRLLKAWREAVEEYGNGKIFGVTGIDIGYRYEGNVRSDEIGIRFMVETKWPLSAIPAEQQLPTRINGEPTDVNVAPFDFRVVVAETRNRRERHNPIQPGISVSHRTRGAGTFGAIVYPRGSEAPAILSCWHVLAPESRPLDKQGQLKLNGKDNEPIYQPSLVDGGDPRFDTVGHLQRAILNLDGDAALALLTKTRLLSAEQLGAGVEVISADEVKLGEELMKSGRGTAITHAMVDGVGRYLIRVRLDGKPTWIEGFRLVPIEGKETEISERGDSGSVWLRPHGAGKAIGVGLHVEGEREGQLEYAVACHLERVLDGLGATLRPIPISDKEVHGWAQDNPQNFQTLAGLVGWGGISPAGEGEPGAPVEPAAEEPVAVGEAGEAAPLLYPVAAALPAAQRANQKVKGRSKAASRGKYPPPPPNGAEGTARHAR